MNNHTIRKAIKEHQCSFCRKPISRGEKYMYCRELHPGVHHSLQWYNFCQHIECFHKFSEVRYGKIEAGY